MSKVPSLKAIWHNVYSILIIAWKRWSMYFVFGNEVLDSVELAKKIEESTKLRLVSGLVKAK